MATRLVLNMQGPEDEGGHQFIVNDSFDEVIEKIMPVAHPTQSALDERQRCLYTGTDGRRIFCPPHYAAFAESDYDDEEDDV